MQIAATRQEMFAVVESARSALSADMDATRRDKILLNARREIERIRKAFKRRIDDRALYKPGDQWFSINSREGIERRLAEVTQEALSAIDALQQQE